VKLGTRSLLFGVHQVFVHPFIVGRAWHRQYGFPLDPRLWVAFVVHDWGYWGKADMNGPEGSEHTEFGGVVMGRLFGPEWGDFARYHSRERAMRDGRAPSLLCIADKLAIAETPTWMYLILSHLSGEIHEYTAQAFIGDPQQHPFMGTSEPREWLRRLKYWVRLWIQKNADSAQSYVRIIGME
jgi:hypothetical protein